MQSGHHLIAGQWTEGSAAFQSAPAIGAARAFSVGTPAHVDAAVRAAEAAFALASATFAPLGLGGLHRLRCP